MSAEDTKPMMENSEEIAEKAVSKRYQGLVTVKSKANKGKGAWFWAHLEPILITNPETSLPKAVKLRCTLCDTTFSASNPSRTATEHLKRGTCPNFSSHLSPISPISSISPPADSNSNNQSLPLNSSRSNHVNHRKRGAAAAARIELPSSVVHANHVRNVCSSNNNDVSSNCNAPALVEAPRFGYESEQKRGGDSSGFGGRENMVLSGGKEDLGALTLLEDSVKKLKGPKSLPSPRLSQAQIDLALGLLVDWFYESCGSVSISSLEHPKFREFLEKVGLPVLSKKDISGARLDSKFDEAKAVFEARIRDAMFFQVASDGWRKTCASCGEESVVTFTINLPNGTSVFQKAALGVGGKVPSKYVEEVMLEAITELCGSDAQRCVGIVADKHKAKALQSLESQNQWMINLSCQLQGFISLVKDFGRDLPLFKTVTENCIKIANFVNSKPQNRTGTFKLDMQGLDHTDFLRVPKSNWEFWKNFPQNHLTFHNIFNCARTLQLVVTSDSYKLMGTKEPFVKEIAEMIQDVEFWNEMEAVISFLDMISEMVQEIEAERPLIGRCLPLWEELRGKVKDWCARFCIAEGPVEKIVEKRFKKNYHPAWSAAYILDPLYLMRDTCGKYLPPFKHLTNKQEKDVDKLITRLVSREEAHIVLMELMKWRSEGLDPLYAQAVQVKVQDPATGKMKIANPQSSRLVWETCLSGYKSLGKVAARLIFLHATSVGFKCHWSFMKGFCIQGQSKVGLERAQKMIFVAAHAKLEIFPVRKERTRICSLWRLLMTTCSLRSLLMHPECANVHSFRNLPFDISVYSSLVF